MFLVTRRFFATGTVTEVEKVTTEVAAKLQKEFSEQCANVMKVRGHHKLQMETVKSKNGKEMKFDFSYGWPTRYYCVCNTSSKPLQRMVSQRLRFGFVQVLSGRRISPKLVSLLITVFTSVRVLLREIPPIFVSCLWIQKCLRQ